jgi:hypothetical protein
MATSKKFFVGVLSNTHFSVDYNTNNLEPQIEVILLTQEVKYKIDDEDDDEGAIKKAIEVGEFRIFTSLEGVNDMIGKLQAMASQLQNFQQLSVGFNQLIEHSKKSNSDGEKK